MMHNSEQNLNKIKESHPELYNFININRKLDWLDWQTFLAVASRNDLDNMNQLQRSNQKHNKKNKNRNDPLISAEFRISLIELNGLSKLSNIFVDDILMNQIDYKKGFKTLLDIFRAIDLSKNPLYENNSEEDMLSMLIQKMPITFMKLCEKDQYKNLLLDNNRHALIEFCRLSNEKPETFKSICEYFDSVDYQEQGQLRIDLSEYPSVQSLFDKFTQNQVDAINASNKKKLDNEKLESLIAKVKTPPISFVVERNFAISQLIKADCLIPVEDRLEILTGFLNRTNQLYPDQSTITELISTNNEENDKALRVYYLYMKKYLNDISLGMKSKNQTVTTDTILRELLKKKPENCTDDIEILYATVQIVWDHAKGLELNRSDRSAIYNVCANLLINPVDNTNIENLFKVIENVEKDKKAQILYGLLLLAATIAIIAALVCLCVFVPPVSVLPIKMTILWLALGTTVLSSAPMLSLSFGAVLFAEAGRRHELAKELNKIVTTQASIKDKVFMQHEKLPESSQENLKNHGKQGHHNKK